MTTPPNVRRFVLLPMPRTDARPRRFRLVATDRITGLPSLEPGPGRVRPRG